jgi:hypothetical protein
MPRHWKVAARHHKAAVAWAVLAILGLVQDLLPVALLASVASHFDELQLGPLRWVLDGSSVWVPALVVLVALAISRHLGRLRVPGAGGPEGRASWGPMLALWLLTQVLGLLLLGVVFSIIGGGSGGLVGLGPIGSSWLG